MPQELQVLRCYSCETFQVHIVKKTLKWACKICGEKQSVKKVYLTGSGKDCRLYVQELNQKRLENDLKLSTKIVENVNYHEETLDVKYNTKVNQWTEFLPSTATDNSDVETQEETSNVKYNSKVNRWAEFLPSTATDNSDVENESNELLNYTFEQPIKKLKLAPVKKKCCKTTREPLNGDNNEKICSNILTDNKKCSDSETENKDYLSPGPYKKNKHLLFNRRLENVDKESQINKNLKGSQVLLETKTNKTDNIKSSRWTEFLYSTTASSDEEIENYNLPSSKIKIPSENQEGFNELIPNKAYGHGSGINTELHTHFQSSSSKWNEFKDDQFQQISSSEYQKPNVINSNLEKLFNDGENNLDSIFTF